MRQIFSELASLEHSFYILAWLCQSQLRCYGPDICRYVCFVCHSVNAPAF